MIVSILVLMEVKRETRTVGCSSVRDMFQSLF